MVRLIKITYIVKKVSVISKCPVILAKCNRCYINRLEKRCVLDVTLCAVLTSFAGVIIFQGDYAAHRI